MYYGGYLSYIDNSKPNAKYQKIMSVFSNISLKNNRFNYLDRFQR